MLFKAMVKKVGIFSVSLGLIASPLAFAHSSIELNKDRSVGEITHQPHSNRTSEAATYSATELNHGDSDRMNTNYSPTSHRDSDRQNTNSYKASDLTHDEGDSTDW